MLRFQKKIISLFVLFTISSAKLPDLDDRCYLPNGGQGACKLLNDCPSAIELFRNQSQLPQACTPENADVVICCAGAMPVFKSQSLTKCKEYIAKVRCSMKPLNKVPKDGNHLMLITDFPHIAKCIYKRDRHEEFAFHVNAEGSLISLRYIISAAAPLNRTGWILVQVRFGALDLLKSVENETPVDYDIEKMIVHPNYQPSTIYNDIALIKLLKKVDISQYIHPICLPDTDIQSRIVYRINYMSQVDSSTSMPLVKYQRRFVPNEICNVTYKGSKYFHGINDDFICTTPMELMDSNYDSPFEDAAIIVDHPSVACAHVLLGTSVRNSKSRIADAALNVFKYREWIESIIWADGEDN